MMNISKLAITVFINQFPVRVYQKSLKFSNNITYEGELCV